MSFTNTDTERLINLYHAEPCLWNAAGAEFIDVDKRLAAKAWSWSLAAVRSSIVLILAPVGLGLQQVIIVSKLSKE